MELVNKPPGRALPSRRHPEGSQVLTPFLQTAFALRWFREAGCAYRLACDTRISQATGYRHLHETIDVLADHAPTRTTSSNTARPKAWAT
ncbi:hypothetical protein GCM10009642_45820 [Nocardiopsis metallicus]